MAFPVAPRKDTIDAHSAPPHRLTRLLHAGLCVVRQTDLVRPAHARWPSCRHSSRREADCPSRVLGMRCAMAIPQHACRLLLAYPSSCMVCARTASGDGRSPDGEPRALDTPSAPRTQRGCTVKCVTGYLQ